MPELTPHDAAIYKAESQRLDRMRAANDRRDEQVMRDIHLYGALILVTLISVLAFFYMSKY